MLVSDAFRPSVFVDAIPLGDFVRSVARLRSRLFSGHANRAAALHHVLRLEIVSALGETPSAYGWHVDTLLNVGLQPYCPASGYRRATLGRAPADPGIPARVHRIPRTRASDLQPTARLAADLA